MRPRAIVLAIMLLPLFAPTSSFTQFLPHVDSGSQRGVQDDLTREQLRLRNVEQWRHIREEEFRAEVEQWTTTVQAWREMTGQPRLTQDQLAIAYAQQVSEVRETGGKLFDRQRAVKIGQMVVQVGE